MTPSSALPSQSGTGWFCHLGRGFHCLSCRWPECRSHNRPPGAPEEPSRYLQRNPNTSSLFLTLFTTIWCYTPWSSLLTVVYCAAKSARVTGVSGVNGGTWSSKLTLFGSNLFDCSWNTARIICLFGLALLLECGKEREALISQPPLLGLECNTLVSSQVFFPYPFHHFQTSHRMLHTGVASVHIDGCHERLRRERKPSPFLVNWLYPLYELGRICGPRVWCGWCSVPPGGLSHSPLCMQNQKDTQSQDPRASSQWCLSKNKIKENSSKPRVWARNPWKSLFTCMYISFAQEQRQTLHSFKWVEVVNTLMKAVHAILVLKHRPDNLESHRLDANSTHTQRQLSYLR